MCWLKFIFLSNSSIVHILKPAAHGFFSYSDTIASALLSLGRRSGGQVKVGRRYLLGKEIGSSRRGRSNIGQEFGVDKRSGVGGR